jgi:phospholipid transport system transporter-binding protein
MNARLSKLVLKLPSVLSHDTAAACIESLREQCDQFFAFDASTPLQGAFTVEVDASGVEHFDSSALALLSELKRVVLSHDGVLTLTQVPMAMVRLAQVYGVAELLMSAPESPAY